MCTIIILYIYIYIYIYIHVVHVGGRRDLYYSITPNKCLNNNTTRNLSSSDSYDDVVDANTMIWPSPICACQLHAKRQKQNKKTR